MRRIAELQNCVDKQKGKIKDLEQQRDGLKAACRNLLIFSECDSTCSDGKEAKRQAKTAIAKAEK